MKKISILIFLIFLNIKLQAQNSSENLLGTWYMYNGAHQLSEKYKLTTSAHVRYFELLSEYQQEIYRMGLNYAFSDKINVTGGIVYSITDTSYKTNKPNLYEFRLYQDAFLKDTWGNLGIKHRIRLAQRFREQNAIKKTTHRIRYGLFFNYPFVRNLNFYGFNEVFIKFASTTFGQNRTGFGFIQKINQQIKMKLGYMHTLFNDKKSHRLQLGITLTTNHIKKDV